MACISKILGCGAFLPQRVVTNDDLAELVDTSDEWITARTGVRRRHLAADDEFTSHLATEAARNALEDAGVAANDIDIIVVGTTTPDRTFPATAVRLQRDLGLDGGAAFDLQAVCSGFIYALSVVDSMIRAGQARTALVVGADTMSRLLDWEDRATCVLFGDGAGAVVVQGVEAKGNGEDRSGILSTHLHSDGRLEDLLYTDGGPSTTKSVGRLRMEGKEVFRHAVTKLADVVTEALDANGLTPDDIDWLVPHQANKRIIDSTTRRLQMPADKVILTIEDHANTSAASIPLALTQAVRDGRIQEGDLILMEAMGGGLTWGAALVRW
jgi:3-oxoacyl-[acyl-carrier-protein] synthase-3